MSVHYNVFLGPYAQVHNPVKLRKETIQSCVNPTCDKFEKPSTQTFCSKCGTKIGSLEISVRKKAEFDSWTAFGDSDRLTEHRSEDQAKGMEDYIVFISNTKESGGRQFYDTTEIVPIAPTLPTEEIELFKKTFKKEIAILEKTFGDSAVEIKWGIITCWY